MATNVRFIPSARQASTEVRNRFAQQQEQRDRASTILNPNEVAGDYDAGRLLMTTLGGQIRPLTSADLRAFQQSAKNLGQRYRGGITAKSVIEHSLPEDRERCNREIRVAVPVQRMGVNVHFVTNAGPNSDSVRHHVDVEFLNLDAVIASPTTNADATKALLAGKLKFNCDCGRHRYWFRYLATIGHFNAGRGETGFPKIRNPQLVGVACKHVLRVMQQLTSPGIRLYVEKMIAAGRKSNQAKLKTVTKKEAAAMAQAQLDKAHHKRGIVESSTERRTRLAAQAEAKRVAQASKAKMPSTDRGRATALRKAENTAKLLAAQSGMSAKQLDALLETIRGQFK